MDLTSKIFSQRSQTQNSTYWRIPMHAKYKKQQKQSICQVRRVAALGVGGSTQKRVQGLLGWWVTLCFLNECWLYGQIPFVKMHQSKC